MPNKTLTFIILCALAAIPARPAQIMFGDVDQDYVLYDSSDPFGIIAATNAQALSVSANALGVTATNNAAVALALGVTATNDAANAVALSVTATNNAQTALTLSVTATNQSALATSAAQSVTNTAAVALALSISATNTAATALALGVTATNLSATANTISVTATNSSAVALALAITATNLSAEANATAGIAYLYATNASAEVLGVYTPATNAAAVAALAWSRANLAYTLAGSVYTTSTNAIDIATNAQAQVATAYPAATNALVQATNATAVSAAAYSLAGNAWDTATNAYVVATNAQSRVGLAETNKADKTELANYETVQDAQIVAAVALDAQTLAESAVPTNDVRWLAALTNETDALALAALAGYKPSALWEGTNFNMVIEGNTNLVWYLISPVVTSYIVTLSDNFEETETHTRPAWTNNVFPFDEGNWNGVVNYNGLGVTRITYSSGIGCGWSAPDSDDYPLVLPPEPASTAQGTATVSRVLSPSTQEVYRVDIPALTNIAAVIESLRAAVTNHTANGTIGSDAHLVTGDRALIDSVPSLAGTNALAAVSGTLGTHTNDAPAHVSASDRAAWYGVTNLPSAGCTALALTGATNLVVTGATYAYTADVTNAYWLSIAGTAPSYHYSLTVYGTNACTLADNMRLIGTKTVTGTNCVSFKPWTNGLWEVLWGGK